MALNEITEENANKIPPTDCRLRPDIRLLEQGQIDLASAEKNRIEEKQRAARKERKKKKEEWSPLWFSYGVSPCTGKEDWLYKEEYWKRDWAKCQDIF
ncbi:oxysterol-binding protein-related protein 2-like [Saccostrea cucullata]|uniref:oxysterol-binding protein-related protein 2-like n=1 Tax=Saccostrea cuccullata TaxID=36930 RepID=UPI002ED3B4F3